MAFFTADRVKETSVSTGTAALVLAGAVTGFRTFSNVYTTSDSFTYTIAGGSEWEVGIGHITTSSNMLTRDTVISSSCGNAFVPFASGTKRVFVTHVGSRIEPRTYSNFIATVTPNFDLTASGSSPNLSTALPDMSKGDFTRDYEVYLDGRLMRPGADSSADHDYYPGTSLASGNLKFEFSCASGSVICVKRLLW